MLYCHGNDYSSKAQRRHRRLPSENPYQTRRQNHLPTRWRELTADDVRDYCRSRFPHLKVLAYVKFVSAFAMTVTGKIRKIEMREKMCEELGLRDVPTA
jgi:acyl-CoA synthetase (AMP-forming)/AMP-acid ligase II